MAEQQFCASCGYLLDVGAWPIRLVRMGGHLYHAICWVMHEAPSVKAPVMVN